MMTRETRFLLVFLAVNAAILTALLAFALR